ncbi:uncharacterized protein LOC125221019 [Salvia hispanica]|uniref:uncharacterized protein LOC125221019 n=1 Tax=Salvia hispanica TaxID=49212 RepID=UPI0020092B9F|nr:uncharacterized protein LOC125221019 [Salvia hispanica]
MAEAKREEQEYYEQYRATYEAYVAAANPAAPPPRPTRSNRRYIPRDGEGAHERLVVDYFSDTPRFSDTLSVRVEYFQSRRDAIGRQSLLALQECTCALRQLATGLMADLFDEYLHVGESTRILCLKNFCDDVRSAFGEEFLRAPTTKDCQRLLHLHETVHGFPGMLGSIDCMHRKWKNCPKLGGGNT